MSNWAEREDELGWFGVTIAVSDESFVASSRSDIWAPAKVTFDGSGVSRWERSSIVFSVTAERSSSDAKTRQRALEEARKLASLFLKLTDPAPGAE